MFLHKILAKNRCFYTTNFDFDVFTKLKAKFSNFCAARRMSTNSNLLKPPDHVSGLTVLNKSLFEKTITVPYLILRDVKTSSVLPLVRKFLLKLENFKPVKNISDHETRIYLNPELVTKWDDFNTEIQQKLATFSMDESNLQMESYTLTYDNFSLETILRAVLPPNIEGTSSFTKVGHIVHVNLREHLVPFKDLIGEVLYEKVPNCRTVVNKVANIDNTYRNFNMEILRGEDDMMASVKENKCTFEFDFSKVYWNSRLCTEHERIVNMISSDDIVFDVFAGVGPFSIPLAKKKCHVYANDLNPESYKWLNHNSKKNKVDSCYFNSYNKDGKDFILNEIKELLPRYLNKNRIFIIMNLPALAVEFLSFFVGLYEDKDLCKFDTSPVVIVYCFAKGEDYNSIAKKLILENVGWDVSDKIIDLFRVRTVSSLKEMMRVTLKLDRDILIVMGKNKKINSVFKVAGAKSLKLKAKAKAVKTELKQINIKNKSKITEMDKELLNLQDKIRNTTNKKSENVKKSSKLPSQNNVNSEETRQQSQEALNQLNAMQL